MYSCIRPRTLKKIKVRKKPLSKSNIVPFKPNPGGQQRFFNLIPIDKPYTAKYRWIYLRGGVGSGKSRVGAKFCETKTRLHPKVRGLITAQSYPQLRDSTLIALIEFCEAHGHKLEPKGLTNEETAAKIARAKGCYLNGTYILVRSIESFMGATEKSKETGRGFEVGWIWYDEGAYGQKPGFDTLNTRMRWTKGNFFCHGVVTSSINKNDPYNYMYDLFDDPSRSQELKNNYISIKIETAENAKYLGEDYERSQKIAITKELYLIEFKGDYAVAATNRVFSYFKRDQHVIPSLGINDKYAIHVSLDFNHNPACAIAAQYDERAEELIIIKEWYLKNSDTFQLSEAIASWYLQVTANTKQNYYGIKQHLYVHGDASGNQKTANSKNTNWEIVKNTLKKKRIKFRTKYKKANPAVKDTVNSVNCGFTGNKIYVYEECKELIKDLNVLQWTKDGDIDKKDIKRSHNADCLRYLVEDVMPYNNLARVKSKHRENIKPVGVIA